MAHELKGRVWLLPDGVEASMVLPRRYVTDTAQSDEERARHLFEECAPGLVDRIGAGDILWAGDGFGGGSSREEAPRLIKTLGVRLVLAASFARIFYRNAINIGLAVAVGDSNGCRDGDEIAVNLVTGEVQNLTRGRTWKVQPVPKAIRPILAEGGLISYIQRYGSLSEGPGQGPVPQQRSVASVDSRDQHPQGRSPK